MPRKSKQNLIRNTTGKYLFSAKLWATFFCQSISFAEDGAYAGQIKREQLDFFFFVKLHFTILNCTLIYTYHHELLKYTIITLNYNLCSALQPTIH